MDGKDFTLSDGSRINTKGFRVDLTGGRYERFDSNPVMLYDHDTKHLIGRWENRRIENGLMKAKPVFNLKNAFAAEKAQEVDDEFLRGASIGLIPYKMEQIGDDYVLTDWELIEASITPIPSDAGAVRLYNEKREQISFEQFKLSFNNNQFNNQEMADEKKINLSAATCKTLKLSGDYTERDIELAVQEQVDTIELQAKEIKELKEAEIDTYLLQAVKDGKLQQDEVADQRELALLNFEKVKSLIDKKPTEGSASLSDMTQRTNLNGERANWSWMDWAKKDGKGLEQLRHSNPTEFERLRNEYKQSKK